VDEPDDIVAPIAALFDEHCGFVWRSLRHLGVDEPALDDAVQDVFITAYRRWASFERRSSARTWLFGIARRIAFRYRRSARTRSRWFVAADAAREAAEHPVDRIHAAQALATMIARLDRDKRAVFVLSEIEGMTAPEVSEALGIPLGTAYSRLRAAWQLLGRAAGQEQRRAEMACMRIEPSEASRRRMWGAIAVGLSPVRVATTATLLGQLQWLAAGALIGAGVVGLGVVAMPSAHDDAQVVSRTATVVAEEPARDVPVEPSHQRDAVVDAPLDAPRTTTARTIEASRGHRVQDAPPPSTPDLAEELRLVRGAKAAIRDTRADEAIALREVHARRFPEGQLAAERRSTRVAALCSAGRHAEAEAEARALGLTRPAC
jgi:RNA polymerase sigma factor (sigma-70 family)